MFEAEEYQDERFAGLEARNLERSGVAFYDCTFENCNFGEAKLTAYRFVGCTFENCGLGLADLTDSRFHDGRFEGCKLIGVAWSQLRSDPGLPPEVDYVDCLLDFGDFSGLDLSGRTLRQCRLHEATFHKTVLAGADLGDSDLRGSNFVGCDLRGADFRGARNYQIDPRYNRLEGAKFSLPEALGLLAAFEVELS